MKRWCFLLWLLFCFHPLHPSNQRCGKLFQIRISNYFIIKKTPNAVNCCLLSYIFNMTYMQFSCYEQWNRRKDLKGWVWTQVKKRADRQKDPSRPKDSSTEQRDITFEKQVLHQDIFMSLCQHKRFSTQRIGLLRIKPTKRVLVIDVTTSENFLQVCSQCRSWIKMGSERTELWLFFLPWLWHYNERAKTSDKHWDIKVEKNLCVFPHLSLNHSTTFWFAIYCSLALALQYCSGTSCDI